LFELLSDAWDGRLRAIFDDFPSDDAQDGNSCYRYWFTRCGDARILTLMGTTSSPAVGDLLVLGDGFFYGEVEVGEARAIGCDRRF
jgi:hypothetical protein